MDQQRIAQLLEKYHLGTATEQEDLELSAWYDSFENKPGYIQKLSQEQKDTYNTVLYQKLNQSVKLTPAKSIKLWTKIVIAASFIIAIGAGLIIYKAQQTSQPISIEMASREIHPGKNAATLTLSDGRKIILSGTKTGELAKEAGVSITKSANGEIIYTIVDQTGSTSQKENTLSTANGETYMVILPDKSKVWLNAASEIRYPASFASAKSRKVSLQGEAYFEIAKDKAHPFIVSTQKEQVEVLGTHFNINAYSDEPDQRTALLEGSIRLSGKGYSRLLIPGQKAILKGEKLSIAPLNTEETLAWKNGMFVFSDETLESIMRKIARWYDVEVIYQTTSKEETFGGSFPRYGNISTVLKNLSLTGKVSFKVEGRKIYVQNARRE